MFNLEESYKLSFEFFVFFCYSVIFGFLRKFLIKKYLGIKFRRIGVGLGLREVDVFIVIGLVINFFLLVVLGIGGWE